MSEDGNSRIGDGEQENVAGSGNSSTDRELTDSHTVLCQKKGGCFMHSSGIFGPYTVL
jgi:hypothetical protein